MTDAIEEQVLCTAAANLPHSWQPEAGSIRLTEVEWLAALESIQLTWMSRPLAEGNPEFKQWIPYAVLRNHRGELAAYPRGGGEKRLHGLWSLGVGGHVNPPDDRSATPGNSCWGPTLWNGLRRELAEEYPGAARGETRFIGLIHESRTPVGRVHIGAVFLHQVSESSMELGSELTGLRWVPHSAIGGGDWPLERFEIWSRLALELLP